MARANKRKLTTKVPGDTNKRNTRKSSRQEQEEQQSEQDSNDSTNEEEQDQEQEKEEDGDQNEGEEEEQEREGTSTKKPKMTDMKPIEEWLNSIEAGQMKTTVVESVMKGTEARPYVNTDRTGWEDNVVYWSLIDWCLEWSEETKDKVVQLVQKSVAID